MKCPVIENKTFVSGNAAEAMDQLGVRSPKWQEGTYEYFPSQKEPVEYMDDLYYNVKIVNGVDSVDSDECYKQGNISHGIIKATLILPSIVRSVSLDEDDKKADEAIYLLRKQMELL